LVSDIESVPGAQAKKWFTTINLLICQKVDDAADGYSIEPITADNVNERRYFGVTHLLRSSANQDHVIQVIALKDLRESLVANEAFVPRREVVL
jgi:hypothetical protein